MNKILVAALCCGLAATATAAPHSPKVLDDLLDAVSESARRGERPWVLFDIDDTLTSTDGRHRRIIREFVADSGVRARFPQETARLETALSWPRLRYDIKDTARDAGVESPEFLTLLSQAWLAKFFVNDYIPEDEANPGAGAFVREVIRRGGTAAYFTGRWEALRPGTVEGLRRNGFPLPGEPGAVLLLKQDQAQADADFKGAKIRELVALGVRVVGGFDNEPRNINVFRSALPGGVVVFLDTKQSGALDPSTGKPIEVETSIPWVADFTRPAPARSDTANVAEARRSLAGLLDRPFSFDDAR